MSQPLLLSLHRYRPGLQKPLESTAPPQRNQLIQIAGKFVHEGRQRERSRHQVQFKAANSNWTNTEKHDVSGYHFPYDIQATVPF